MWSAIVSRLSTTTPRSRAESTILTTEPKTFSSRIVSLSTLHTASPATVLGSCNGRIQTQSACSHPRLYVSKTTREPVDSIWTSFVGVQTYSWQSSAYWCSRRPRLVTTSPISAVYIGLQDKQQGAQNWPLWHPVQQRLRCQLPKCVSYHSHMGSLA